MEAVRPPVVNLVEYPVVGLSRMPLRGVRICFSTLKLATADKAHWRTFGPSGRNSINAEASKKHWGPTQELKDNKLPRLDETGHGVDSFRELKNRFLSFKRKNYLENAVHFQKLAQDQAPKFMVIACADSRVCPSIILGFQPGEAFTIRNVANLVPPFLHGPSETSAALEFAVISLEVRNILVIGHSCCGGIQALMSMNKEAESSFIRDWVSIGKNARLSTKAAAGNLSFETQCRHCEKESLNGSMLNLLTYPWIEKRVAEGKLSVHGGYYDFLDCTFESWTLVNRKNMEGGSKYGIKNCYFWS